MTWKRKWINFRPTGWERKKRVSIEKQAVSKLYQTASDEFVHCTGDVLNAIPGTLDFWFRKACTLWTKSYLQNKKRRKFGKSGNRKHRKPTKKSVKNVRKIEKMSKIWRNRTEDSAPELRTYSGPGEFGWFYRCIGSLFQHMSSSTSSLLWLLLHKTLLQFWLLETAPLLAVAVALFFVSSGAVPRTLHTQKRRGHRQENIEGYI